MIVLKLFAGIAIEGHERPLSGRAAQRHRLALLAMLAASQPRAVSRDKLIAHLWPENDAAHARNLLNQAAHALRQLLGKDAIVSHSDSLTLSPERVASDVGQFEEAIAVGHRDRAVELYAGPFLDGFFLGGCPEFERWTDGERDRLRRSYLKALQGLAERASAQGDRQATVEWWQRLAAEDPSSAQVTVGLMRALESYGDRAAAIRQAQTHAALLREEFDAEPSPEVVALAGRLRKEPGGRTVTVTPVADTGPASAHPPPSNEQHITPIETRLPATARRVGLRHPGVLVAALFALVVALGLWQGLGGKSETTLDTNLVAVMPFRTTGADPSLAYLREGMMDLLAAKLTGEGGPRAADPRTVMVAWGRVASADDADLSEEQAAGVARTIGAGRLLLGSVVGSPSHFVLSATLTSVGATSIGANQATVEGPADSLPVMLDRLTGKLLAGVAGVRDAHGASLTTSSLDALKAYLDGRAAGRVLQMDQAAQQFSHALGVDSGFTLAAFALMRTAGWGAVVADSERVAEIAWEGRSRLSPRDRVLLEAYLGPQGLEPQSVADILGARERAVTALPDEADAWFLLGDTYMHNGAMLGFPDHHERAARAFERAIALDSTWVIPLAHLLTLATDGSDTTEIRQLWELAVQLDSTSWEIVELRFSVAVALGDDAMLAAALDRFAAQPHVFAGAGVAGIELQKSGRGGQYLDTLIAIMQSQAQSQRERRRVATLGYSLAMNRGRPREASVLLSTGGLSDPRDDWHADWYPLRALYWNGLLEDTAVVLRWADSAARAPFGPTAAEIRGQLLTACRLALWRLARGDTRGVAPLLERLEAGLTMGDSVLPDRASPYCPSLVRAMLAVRRGRTDAMALVERTDSLMLQVGGPADFSIRGFQQPRVGLQWWTLTVARLFEDLGALERALAVLRRYTPYSYLSTKLREEGRLAALTGDREGAIKAYSHYLEFRSDPEPEVLPEVEAVRAELARLVGAPE